jgi:hypothetical protein
MSPARSESPDICFTGLTNVGEDVEYRLPKTPGEEKHHPVATEEEGKNEGTGNVGDGDRSDRAGYGDILIPPIRDGHG